MPAASSVLQDSSLPSVAATGTYGVTEEATPDRKQEFDSILAHALPRFRRMAMRWLRNPEDAEDAVQEAMLLAFRHLSGFHGRAQMSTWLTTIVINAARGQLRRRARCAMFSLDYAPDGGPGTISDFLVDSRPTPDKTLEQSNLYELVMKLASGLPLSQRAALLLCSHNGLSIRRAAETLGVPEGTVKVRLARARANLTKRFQHATRSDKSSDSDLKARSKACSSAYRNDRGQRIPHLPAVFREQGGCQGWVNA